MITTTLDAMAAGGIHDQLGGGFARYSTDDRWLVPHFEKMLYDNALLTRAYLHGFLVTGETRYRAVVEDIVGYVLRDLRHTNGGFFSAEDADSEGVEGKFYCWEIEEIREVCGDDADATIAYFGVTEAGNFVDPHTGFRGNILHVRDRNAEPPVEVESAKSRLLAPARRPGPSRPRRQGPPGVERAHDRRPRRGGGRVRPRRLDGCRPHERALPALRASPRRRPLPALVAGPLPRLRRGLRRAARDPVHAGRARRRGLARRRPCGRRRNDHAVPRHRRRRLLHHGQRRREARRPPQGRLRRRDAVGELAGRQRAAPPRRAHRRAPVRGTGAGRGADARPRRRFPPERLRAPPGRARARRHEPARDRDRRRPRRPENRGPPPRGRDAPRPRRGDAHRIRPAPPPRSSRAARRATVRRPRTSASTTPAGSPSRTRPRSATSSTPCSRPGARRISRRRGRNRPRALRRRPSRRRSSPGPGPRRANRRATRSSRRRWPSPGSCRAPRGTAACGPSPRP